MSKSGVPRKSPDWCAWTFLYLSRSVGGARGVRFLPGPTSFTLQRCKYERKLFAKFFWNLGNYFLNPRNYFLIWVPKLETTDKPRFAFTNPEYWTRMAVDHLKSRDCPRQVSHVVTKRERERERERLSGCWCRRSSVSSFPCSLPPHLRISHCFFLFHLYRVSIDHNVCLYLPTSFYPSLFVSCLVWWFEAG